MAGFLSSALNFLATERANKQAVSLSRDQMEWQERLSNTAHQREVSDLRKAGLNPILSATGGSGASVPSGSVPQIQAAKFDFDDLGPTDYLAWHNAKLQNDLLKSQNNFIKKQIAEIDSRIDLNSASAEKARSDSMSLMNLPGKALRSIPNSAIDSAVQKIVEVEERLNRFLKDQKKVPVKFRNRFQDVLQKYPQPFKVWN